MDVPGYALVTGAGSGIGRACANTFARDGAAGVALFDVNLEGLNTVKAEIEEKAFAPNGKACRVIIQQVDISKEEDVSAAVKSVAQEFGRLDYVANAAGIAMKHEGGAAFAQARDWQRILDINLSGSLFILKASAQIMLKQDAIASSIDGRPLQKGSIVLFGSIQSVAGIPLSTAYAASKAGVLGLMRSASEDYAAQGLRINAICPGYTETPLTTQNPGVFKAMQERVTTVVPMMRVGKPQEIADGVVYLAGGRSSFVTGTALMVDGGYTER
ncbi:putative short-chain dehydrogenase reductase sdr [Rosellinia necatrix]|uniref:Putative short-chain dehydrogenase reductase sdr n=1 Tax=Rosellinia necatrix TaxID=77044 RepID=A0A1W2TC25_ROSNE|nr:putative short-chain dehydrogenase reductase sdr [Rosellinia necatrix]